MPVTDITLTKQEGGNFEPLPADVYQVQIVDITKQDGQYNGKPTVQFQFDCQIAAKESDKDWAKRIRFWTSTSWNMGGGKYSPSKMYLLVTAIYKHYKPEVDTSSIQSLSAQEINDLIGKQVRVNLEVRKNEEGKERNKVSGFLPVKDVIPFEPVDYAKTEKKDDFLKEVGLA